MLRCFNDKRGQSIIEVMIAVVIFALVASTMMSFALGGLNSLQQGGEQTKAEMLAQEGIESVYSIRETAWNKLIYTTSSVEVSGSELAFTGENTTENIGKYTRSISFEDVCRDGSDEIVACPGTYTDIHSKKAIVDVSWNTGSGKQNVVHRIAYITNWDSQDWTQTNWAGGDGQTYLSDSTMYDSQDGNIDHDTSGEIKLASTGTSGCTAQSWTLSTPADYSYNNLKIEVASGLASIIDQGGGSSCGGTQTACVDISDSLVCGTQAGCSWASPDSGSTVNDTFVNLTNWTYTDWDEGGGEVDATGSNPSGYAQINIPSGRGDELGGFFYQPFTTTINNPSNATLDLDWLVSAYNASPNTFQMYVFVDSALGAPVIGQQVWSSAEISATQGWTSISAIDVSSKLGIAGTYYLKIAVWVETSSVNKGPFTIGYDNVLLNWSGTGTCNGTATACGVLGEVPCGNQDGCAWSAGTNYPSDEPTINPITSISATGLASWGSFTETASKDGGEIYYQLSSDGGVTWKYWDTVGSVWSDAAGATDYNTATVINLNITAFPINNEQILFKAFLVSDGSQYVQLDEIAVSCTQSEIWGFTDSGLYTYDNVKIEIVSGQAQLIGSGGGGGSCGGTATACNISNFANQTSCNAQDGCTWNAGGVGTCVNTTGGFCANNGGGGVCNSCSTAGCSFSKGSCSGSLNCTDYGTNQASCIACGQCLWAGTPSSCDGTATTCNSGSYTDDISCVAQTGCSWTPSSVTYPSDSPTVYPSASLPVTGVITWDSFTEIATKNGGQIYYQLSDDDGVTWYWWNGATWSEAVGTTDYNIATVINTNIPTFSIVNEKIMFKAFLESNGSQFVQLDSVSIGYSGGFGGGGGTYQASGDMLSSAFNMGSAVVLQAIEWNETIPANTDLQIQVRTAPDNAGVPGIWTNWYGASGSGTYFTEPAGTLVSTVLNGNQWLQYRVEMTSDGNDTPVLTEVRINYK